MSSRVYKSSIFMILRCWFQDQFLMDFGANLGPKIDQKSIKNRSKIDQKSIKIGPWRGKGTIWEGPGAHLGPKRPPDPSKSPPGKIGNAVLVSKILQNRVQNRTKVVKKSIPKAIIFLMDFWWILLPHE